MIIDVHSHLGYDVVFDDEQDEVVLVEYGERYGVTASIVQPFVSRPYIEDTEAAHDRIKALCDKYPGRFFGMASINPHLRREDYEREASRCVRELGFVGLKLTPIAHAVNPPSRDGRMVFEVAQELGVPLMIHTGSGAPFADPARLMDIIEDFPALPVVLAHAGTDLMFSQALWLAKHHDNVFLEPSWCSVLSVRRALRSVGAGKLLFSSDHAVNIPVELAKYTVLLKGEELERVLYKNAMELYGLLEKGFPSGGHV